MILAYSLILIGIAMFVLENYLKDKETKWSKLIVTIIKIFKLIIFIWLQLLFILMMGSFMSSFKEKYWDKK